MHSSDNYSIPPKRRKVLVFLLLIVILAAALYFLDFALYPCTFTRNDIHTVTSARRDVILLGASNGKMGIDPDVLLEGTGKTGHNLCCGGQYTTDSYYLAQLIEEKQHPELIIYVVDPGYMLLEKEPGNNNLVFYHEFPLTMSKIRYGLDIFKDADFRSVFFPFYEYSLGFELSSLPETTTRKLTKNYDVENLKSDTQEYHENGFIERYPVAIEDFPSYSPLPFSRDKVLPKNEADLLALIRFCREHDIRFAGVAVPMYGGVLQSEAESWQEAWAYFEELFESEEVPFYNFNTGFYKAFTHEAKAFTDYDSHLNGDAARAFSHVLGQILFFNDATKL